MLAESKPLRRLCREAKGEAKTLHLEELVGGALSCYAAEAIERLGGAKILLIGNVIEQKFKQGNNWNVGSGLSLVLMVFILISMAIMHKYDRDGEGVAF